MDRKYFYFLEFYKDNLHQFEALYYPNKHGFSVMISKPAKYTSRLFYFISRGKKAINSSM